MAGIECGGRCGPSPRWGAVVVAARSFAGGAWDRPHDIDHCKVLPAGWLHRHADTWSGQARPHGSASMSFLV
jgi:hypothetical protein